MLNSEKVKRYFEDSAEDFDNIYENRGNLLTRLINKVFRKGMYERFALVIQECGDVQNKSVLDIGCGSGRISLSLAEKGARVIGIDYSSKMVQLANEQLNRHGASSRFNVEFICCDFMEDFNTDELFDITLALGVLDYIKEPIPFLERVRSLTKGQMFVSYPAKFAFQMPIRKIWLYTKKCPVYFYTERQLATIYESIGIDSFKLLKLPAGYLVKAFVTKRG